MALVAGLVASPVMFTLHLLLGAVMAWKTGIVVLASAYIVYLLPEAENCRAYHVCSVERPDLTGWPGV